MRTGWEGRHRRARRGPFPDADHAGTSDFQPPEPGEYVSVVQAAQSVYFLIEAWETEPNMMRPEVCTGWFKTSLIVPQSAHCLQLGRAFSAGVIWPRGSENSFSEAEHKKNPTRFMYEAQVDV